LPCFLGHFLLFMFKTNLSLFSLKFSLVFDILFFCFCIPRYFKFKIGPYQNRTDIHSMKRNCTSLYTKRPLFYFILFYFILFNFYFYLWPLVLGYRLLFTRSATVNTALCLGNRLKSRIEHRRLWPRLPWVTQSYEQHLLFNSVVRTLILIIRIQTPFLAPSSVSVTD